MKHALKVHIVRVFVNKNGKFGNPVGIILDEKNLIDNNERKEIATRLNFSESIFINDLEIGNVTIYNPKKEVLFAGHAMVGTAWLISKTMKHPINSLVCAGGSVKTWHDNSCT